MNQVSSKNGFCSICSIMWDMYCIIESNNSTSQHSLMNIVNESVVNWLCDERSVAHCPYTCAELRAFHLFPSLAPDLPPTMGSWPRRLTPARTPALPDTVAADIYECISARLARTPMLIVFSGGGLTSFRLSL